MKTHSSIVMLAAISGFLLSSPAFASFHRWNINEIYSNANGTVQYIELFTAFSGEQFTFGRTIRASQGASSNDFVFPSNTPSPTSGHHLLLATPGFAGLPGAVTPDFTLDDGFLFSLDGVVDFIGANRLTYDKLPIDGIMSLHCDTNNGISCTATSIGANSPTNYAGVTGSIDAGGGDCMDTDSDGLCDEGDPCAGGAASGDTDADGSVDLDDFTGFESCLVGPDGGLGTGCECFDFDEDNDLDLIDWGRFQVAFTGKESFAGMVFIPAGEFKMGDWWTEGEPHERPAHRVYLSPYFIDRYEVTNEQYATALNWAYAQGGLITVTSGVIYPHDSGNNSPYCDTDSADAESQIHWDGGTFSVTLGKEDHPVVEVSWYGSVAFSNWRSAMEGKPLCYDLSTWTCDFAVAGYRLPTEAEWEKAAGWEPAQQQHFRFGEQTDGCGYNCLDGQRANYWSSGDPYETGAHPLTTPVGYYDGTNHDGYQTQIARSYYGCFDMSGNAWEWCNDRHSTTYYSSSPLMNPLGASTGSSFVLRGGGWNKFPHLSRSAHRDSHSPGGRESYMGFRCAATPTLEDR